MVSYQLVLYAMALCIFPLSVMMAIKRTTGSIDLSHENTNALRGICIVLIVFHHVSQIMPFPGFMRLFENLGYLGVSVFLFLSGYGLMMSHKKKADTVKSFIRKRLVKVYLPFVLANIVTLSVTVFYMNLQLDAVEIIKYVTGIVLINKSYWFVICIMYLYVVFLVAFDILKLTKSRAVIFISIMTIGYWVFCFYLGLEKWWYTTSFCFLIGGMQALGFLNRMPKAINSIIIIFTLGVSLYFGFSNNQIVACLAKTVSAIAFISLIVFALKHVSINSKIYSAIGLVSYEVYLIHVMPFLYNAGMFHSVWRLLSYFFGVLILALVFNRLTQALPVRTQYA